MSHKMKGVDLMSLFGGVKNFAKKQFLDILKWDDNSTDTLLYKFPMQDDEIQNGGQLVVQEGQVAIFMDKGKIADVFGPGTYKLTTENLPILGDLKGWAFGFKSPFKAEVFFVNTKQFLNQKWGTPQPIWITDPKFEQIEVRAFGSFAFRIKDAVQFLREVTGTNKVYTADEIREQLRDFIVNNFAPIVASQGVTVAELSKNYNVISAAVMSAVTENFARLGLEMTAFTVNISLPEELKEALAKRSAVNITGGMQNYAQIETLEAVKESVKNPGMNAMNQAGLGFGMGINMGNMMAVNMQRAFQNAPTPQPPQQTVSTTLTPASSTKPGEDIVECSNCHERLSASAMFCSKCGTKVIKPEPSSEPAQDYKFCTKCGNKLPSIACFCSRCGNKLG